jgi:2-oxoglutarate dehydrogenase complex, dehydrogenase (E1) component, and related enzymes
MEFKGRVGLALVLLGCFLGAMVVLGTFGDVLFPQDSTVISGNTTADQAVTRAGFQYGPQNWRPGYNPLGIAPGQDVQANESWYLMFFDLNASPVSGDPNVLRTGSVRLTYNFTGLAGRAVFGVYGLTTGTQPTRTNRQTGYNYCSYMVTGNATPGTSMPGAAPLALSPAHQYTVAVSNNLLADSDAMKATTRPFTFRAPAGSGEGALHITSSLAKRMGDVTETTAQDGTFYVTATGTDPGNALILMVAVDRPQPDNFFLRVKSEFVRT